MLVWYQRHELSGKSGSVLCQLARTNVLRLKCNFSNQIAVRYENLFEDIILCKLVQRTNAAETHWKSYCTKVVRKQAGGKAYWEKTYL
jgi:hypothetical protein